MLIIPERNAILIMPPRTGSSTLHNAIRECCPTAFMLYRHAERDAIPPGFEAMEVMGFVRHPHARMWSLYKFICQLDPATSATWAREEVMRLVESVQGLTFEDWLLTNVDLFLPDNSGHPGLYQKHYLPETIKSQSTYLRPDLGTTILPFQDLPSWLGHFGLPALHLNKTTQRVPMPDMTPAIIQHYQDHMSWELDLDLEVL